MAIRDRYENISRYCNFAGSNKSDFFPHYMILPEIAFMTRNPPVVLSDLYILHNGKRFVGSKHKMEDFPEDFHVAIRFDYLADRIFSGKNERVVACGHWPLFRQKTTKIRRLRAITPHLGQEWIFQGAHQQIIIRSKG
jgi:hypothetical protein